MANFYEMSSNAFRNKDSQPERYAVVVN